MTSHVDPETLALYAEGLLDGDEERMVRARLAESEEAQTQLAALTEVSKILASAPAPPMPEGLVARIDEALDAEAKKQHAASADDTPAEPPFDGTAEVVPLRRAHGPTRWLPYLVAAAVVVFVLGAGTAVVNGMFGSVDTGVAPLAQPDEGKPEAALSHRLTMVASGTDYTDDGLAAQGGSVLDRSTAAEEEPEDAPLPTVADERVASDVLACADALGSVYGAAPTLADVASYRGSAAWVMFFPTTGNGSGGHELRVVEPDCADEVDPTSTVLTTAFIPAD